MCIYVYMYNIYIYIYICIYTQSRSGIEPKSMAVLNEARARCGDVAWRILLPLWPTQSCIMQSGKDKVGPSKGGFLNN